MLAALAVILAVSGGFRTTVGGLRLSARSPLPIAFLAFTNTVMWLVAARRAQSIGADLAAVWHAIERRGARIVVAIALAAGILATAFSTRSAAGADASGYLSEAAMFGPGRLFHADQLSDLARGRDPYLTSPLGWRPAPVDGRQSPTYPPGLPLLMTLPQAIGGVTGASLLVTATAVIAVVATGALAATLGGSIAGLIAAVLLAVTPVFLHHSIQPMSDVPVTAAWMTCFFLAIRRGGSSPFAQSASADRRSPGGGWLDSPAAGIACAMAVLIRPNLAPLAIVPLLIVRNRIAFATPVAVAGIVLALLQWLWYGSPLRSGYGSAEELFALTNIAPNASRYLRWLVGTAPALLLAIIAIVRLRTNPAARALTAFAALVVAAYLVYAVFDDWSYLRFLLPAMAVLAVFTAVELAAWIARWPIHVRAPLLFAVVLAVTAHGLWVARSMGTFKLADQLGRVERVAEDIRSRVEETAVIVAGEQSGSVRHYTGRPILRWEAASPQALTESIEVLERQGRPVWIVLDAWENDPFLAKFGSVKRVSLDWPAALEAGTTHRTRLWRLSDRARFLRGEAVDTTRIR